MVYDNNQSQQQLNGVVNNQAQQMVNQHLRKGALLCRMMYR